MAEIDSENFSGLSVAAILSRLERRSEQSRRFGRDVDELFKQLAATEGDSDWGGTPQARLEHALRAARASSVWSTRVDTPPRALRVTAETAAIVAFRALRDCGDTVGAELAELLVDAWSEAVLLPRTVFADIVIEAATPPVLRSVELSVMRRAHRLRHQVTALMDTLSGGSDAPQASAREHVLYHARLQSRAGRIDDALETLDPEPLSDPKVSLAYAEVLVEHGRTDAAIDRLRRCLVVIADKRQIRERLLEVFLDVGDAGAAIDQAIHLVAETGEVTAWDAVCVALGESHGDQLRAVRDALETDNPPLYVELLMAQGDAEAVARASRAKTFSYEQLWRIGDFLAGEGGTRAARVYERAIALQGAVAQSKLQCQDLGMRLEAVTPYFVSIERPTKVQRLAKELLATHKNNVPLRREFERLYGAGFK
ncbi:MAG: hypothetical protein H6698_06135 [Myxococcales bacterium]|nr:hypothetical protein [Myxococcales bacterium]MCB9521701.1 hypothetical protein [Myxococcales bacterium]MCB9531917.1 hypothetical protein [Myxococcales bacterium]MCB9533885.1 hypothetical protein [Myxococcales bacterium]